MVSLLLHFLLLRPSRADRPRTAHPRLLAPTGEGAVFLAEHGASDLQLDGLYGHYSRLLLSSYLQSAAQRSVQQRGIVHGCISSGLPCPNVNSTASLLCNEGGNPMVARGVRKIWRVVMTHVDLAKPTGMECHCTVGLLPVFIG